MMKRGFWGYRVLTICLMTLACGAIASCSGDPPDDAEGADLTSERALHDLAQQYLFDTRMSPQQRDVLMGALRMLSPIDSVRLFQELRVLQGMPSTAEVAGTASDKYVLHMDDAINQMAIETKTPLRAFG